MTEIATSEKASSNKDKICILHSIIPFKLHLPTGSGSLALSRRSLP